MRSNERCSYRLSGDYTLSANTHPLHAGRVVREVVRVPNDSRFPDETVCVVWSGRADAERILAALREVPTDDR